jgi:hypothetical protein
MLVVKHRQYSIFFFLAPRSVTEHIINIYLWNKYIMFNSLPSAVLLKEHDNSDVRLPFWFVSFCLFWGERILLLLNMV